MHSIDLCLVRQSLSQLRLAPNRLCMSLVIILLDGEFTIIIIDFPWEVAVGVAQLTVGVTSSTARYVRDVPQSLSVSLAGRLYPVKGCLTS